jgi:membrane protease YdiL (CAAX protease family)
MDFIKNHFRRYAERKPWDFCWRIGVESTLVSMVAAVLLTMIIGMPKREFVDYPIEVVFVLLILVAPPVETVLFQAIPIFIVRLFKGSIRTQILASTILFAAGHFPEGIAVGVSAGIIGGLYFSFAYAHWRTKSRWHPLWVTTVAHGIHNGIAFVLLVVLGNW